MFLQFDTSIQEIIIVKAFAENGRAVYKEKSTNFSFVKKKCVCVCKIRILLVTSKIKEQKP